MKTELESHQTMRPKLHLSRVGSVQVQGFYKKLYNKFLVEILHSIVPSSQLIFKKEKT